MVWLCTCSSYLLLFQDTSRRAVRIELIYHLLCFSYELFIESDEVREDLGLAYLLNDFHHVTAGSSSRHQLCAIASI